MRKIKLIFSLVFILLFSGCAHIVDSPITVKSIYGQETNSKYKFQYGLGNDLYINSNAVYQIGDTLK